jgi:hypothetical protein
LAHFFWFSTISDSSIRKSFDLDIWNFQGSLI